MEEAVILELKRNSAEYSKVVDDIVRIEKKIFPKLAVKEKYRRQGYGEALLKAAISKCQARNIQRISLHVDPSRMPAVSLYQKLGFRIDSTVEKYYSADRDAYRMYLDLDIDDC